MAGGREGVHPVLEHIQIERTQVHNGELVDRVVDAVELEGCVPVEHFFGQLAGAGQHIAVERKKFGLWNAVAYGVETVQVAQQKAEGVAQLAINFRAALHEVFAGRHVFAKIDGGHPQADDFAAHAVGNIYRVHAVAERFAHGPALLVQCPASGRNVGVGRAPAQRNRGQQRRVEPAAMLIAAFEVQHFSPFAVLEGRIRGLQLGVALAYGKPACAGVKPHVEDVGFLAECRAAAMGAGGVSRQQRGDLSCVPCLGAVLLKQLHDFAIERRVQDGLLAAFAKEDRDGHAPDALAADAPVGARGDHVGDALLAPGRVPDHLVDLLDGLLAEGRLGAVGTLDRCFKANEPLLGGAENDRMVAAPAVRVRVLQVVAGQQRAGLFEHGHDDGICSPHLHAIEGRRRVVVPGLGVHMDATGGVNAAGGVDVVADAGVEVVRAVRGRRVDRAGARVGGNIGGQHAQNAALQKWMLEGGIFKDAAFEARQFGGLAQFAGCGYRRGQLCRDNVDWRVRCVLICCRGGQRHVLEVGMEGHGHRRWQRPRGSGPDNGVNFAAG